MIIYTITEIENGFLVQVNDARKSIYYPSIEQVCGAIKILNHDSGK